MPLEGIKVLLGRWRKGNVMVGRVGVPGTHEIGQREEKYRLMFM
jgi:hypothetical protein